MLHHDFQLYWRSTLMIAVGTSVWICDLSTLLKINYNTYVPVYFTVQVDGLSTLLKINYVLQNLGRLAKLSAFNSIEDQLTLFFCFHLHKCFVFQLYWRSTWVYCRASYYRIKGFQLYWRSTIIKDAYGVESCDILFQLYWRST